MEKAKINYIIDAGLAVSFVSVAATGIIKFPGLLRVLGIDLKNLPFQLISTIHDWSGIVMSVLVLVHLVMHWKWIVCMTKSWFKGKTCER